MKIPIDNEYLIYIINFTISAICVLAYELYPIDKLQEMNIAIHSAISVVLFISMTILIIVHVNRHRLVID
jgi:hypothetical protein